MKSTDISNNKTITSLSALGFALRHTATPIETLNAVRAGFAQAYGASASVLVSNKGLPAGQYRVLQIDLNGEQLPMTAESMAGNSADIYENGIIGQIIREPKPQLLSQVRWEDDPHFSDRLGGYGSVCAVPLSTQTLPMNWVLLIRATAEVFSTQELEDMLLRTVLISSLVDSQALSEQLAGANRHIEREMRDVGDLQRALLPDPVPHVPGLEFAVSYEPSGRAGGDLYDVFPMEGSGPDEGRWCIVIGDASGHGIAAAVVMAIVQTLLHAHPDRVRGPAELLSHTNRHLCAKHLGGFVTMFLGVYEPATGSLVYSSAGHPPPLHKSAATNVVCELCGAGTYPIGIDADQTFREADATLGPGDLLLMYTDGVTEARNPDGKLLDLDAVRTAVRAEAQSPVKLIECIRRLVKDHEQGVPASDDQTMLVAVHAFPG